MIISDHSNNGRVFHISRKALEALVLSLGLVSSLAMVALSPHSCGLVFSSLMASWNSVKCLLSSHLCICIIINFMVLLIAASSHRPEKIEDHEHDNDDRASPDIHDRFLAPEQPIEPETIKEALVTKDIEEEVDTMEATWRSINGDGKPEPTKKNLVKCETWDMPPENNVSRSTPKWKVRKELRKSETFNDSVSMRCRGGMIRRDPSSSLEEFNKQVEDFIKRFNDDMKLQRQESADQRFLNMVKRGL